MTTSSTPGNPTSQPTNPAPKKVRKRRVQQRTVETREKILQAALDAFAELGFDGAKTRDIAAQAGVNQGLITYHYSSKEALWQAAVDRIFALLRAQMALSMEEGEDGGPVNEIRRLVDGFVRFCAVHPELFRFMMKEGTHPGPRLQWLVDKHLKPFWEYNRRHVLAVQEAGIYPPGDPIHMHYILLGACTSLFVLAPECQLLTGIDPKNEAVVSAHIQTLVSLLLPHSRTLDPPQ